MLLNIQMTTVSTFKSRIFEKLGINNVVKLIDILKMNFLHLIRKLTFTNPFLKFNLLFNKDPTTASLTIIL